MAEEIPVHKIHKYAVVYCEKIIKGVCNINDADWQKIQELFAKERQWMTGQMQKHIREVNEMFYDERKGFGSGTRNTMKPILVIMCNISSGSSASLVSSFFGLTIFLLLDSHYHWSK